MTIIFIHGLDSSSQGTKATWFRRHFPAILLPDFNGSLAQRLKKLQAIAADRPDLLLIGSSFGGLVASIFGLEHPSLVKRLILLAPALNFPPFSQYAASTCQIPTHIYIGRNDTVCPPEEVLAAATRFFTRLTIHQSDDDHLLHKTFTAINWTSLLS